jgi:hypothetical protein
MTSKRSIDEISASPIHKRIGGDSYNPQIILRGGSNAVDWLIAKRELEHKFHVAGCYDYIIGSTAQISYQEPPTEKEYLLASATLVCKSRVERTERLLRQELEADPKRVYQWANRALPIDMYTPGAEPGLIPILPAGYLGPQDGILLPPRMTPHEADLATSHQAVLLNADSVPDEEMSLGGVRGLLDFASALTARDNFRSAAANHAKQLEMSKKPVLAAGRIFSDHIDKAAMNVASAQIAKDDYAGAWRVLGGHYLQSGITNIGRFTSDAQNARFELGESLAGFYSKMKTFFERLAIANALTNSHSSEETFNCNAQPYVPNAEAIEMTSWDLPDAEIEERGHVVFLSETTRLTYLMAAVRKHPTKRFGVAISVFENQQVKTYRMREFIKMVTREATSTYEDFVVDDAHLDGTAYANLAATNKDPAMVKKCANHPQSTTHWTSECRINDKVSSSASTDPKPDKHCTNCAQFSDNLAKTHNTSECRRGKRSKTNNSNYNNNKAIELQQLANQEVSKQLANMAATTMEFKNFMQKLSDTTE